MRKLLPLLFLLLFFVSQIGYRIIYIIQQHQIKELAERQILQNMPEAYMDMIDAETNKNEIVWEEDGKEFSLDGRLYDVAKIKFVNGRKILCCVNDKTEEEFLDDISKSIKSGADQNSDNKGTKMLIKLKLPDCILSSEKNISLESNVKKLHNNFNSPLIISIIREINTPPPRLNS